LKLVRVSLFALLVFTFAVIALGLIVIVGLSLLLELLMVESRAMIFWSSGEGAFQVCT